MNVAQFLWFATVGGFGIGFACLMIAAAMMIVLGECGPFAGWAMVVGLFALAVGLECSLLLAALTMEPRWAYGCLAALLPLGILWIPRLAT